MDIIFSSADIDQDGTVDIREWNRFYEKYVVIFQCNSEHGVMWERDVRSVIASFPVKPA